MNESPIKGQAISVFGIILGLLSMGLLLLPGKFTKEKHRATLGNHD